MIILDTHIWVWWVHGHQDLKPWMLRRIEEHEADGIGVSAISCWEVARLAARGRLDLAMPTADWFNDALTYPGVELIDLSPEIAIEANRLPGTFHKDPADQIIVATARVLNCGLLTADARILGYPHVVLVQP